MENVNPNALSQQQLQELYINCVKLAAENKISVNNTWQFQLIEHLDDLVKPMPSDDGQVNFQRASCTIDAGVKIYSYRVDSIANEVMKMLGGGLQSEHQPDNAAGDEGADGEGTTAPKRPQKRRQSEVNPEATLKDIEDITLKDVGRKHGVDPLFQKMSAQFDAGGPTGLLLYNLRVGHGGNILLDSNLPFDAPSPTNLLNHEVKGFNISSLESVMAQLDTQTPSSILSPGLDVLMDMLGQPVTEQQRAEAEALIQAAVRAGGDGPCAPSGPVEVNTSGIQAHHIDSTHATSQVLGMTLDLHDSQDEAGFDGLDNFGAGDEGSDVEQWATESPRPNASAQPSTASAAVATGSPYGGALSMDGGTSEGLLADLLNNSVASSIWSGTSHWRFHKPSQAVTTGRGADNSKRKKTKAVTSLSFLDTPADVDIKLAPESEISLKTMTTANTLVAEEQLRSYDASCLARLFLLPNVAIASHGKAHHSGDVQDAGFYVQSSHGDEDDDCSQDLGADMWECQAGENSADIQQGDTDSSTLQLVNMPTRAAKVQVTYARKSKQVDVRALKETLWQQALQAKGASPTPDVPLQFSSLVASIPVNNPAGSLTDLSVHLCFICLLHLANEQGLVIRGTDHLNELCVSNIASS